MKMDFTRLIWLEPWLTPVVLNLRQVIADDHAVETAGVTPDGTILYYSPTFWKGLSRDERLGVQIHELLHIVNLHERRRDGRQHRLWNIACDMAINYQITASGYVLPDGVLPGENDTAEHIYDRLVKENSGGGRGQDRSRGAGGNPGDGAPSGGPPLQDDLRERNADGTTSGPDNCTLDAVESAGRLAGTGTTPLSAQYRPAPARADWRVVLQNLVKSVVGDKMDYHSYTFDEFGVCEDILSPKPRPKLCVLVDESGSISDRLYEQFLGELNRMSRFAEVYVSGFADETELHAVLLDQYCRTMTGGTDVRTAYEQACRAEFDCILILTDGYLPFPESEPKPTIWVMPESFGRNKEVLL